jgi:hypothetical protein
MTSVHDGRCRESRPAERTSSSRWLQTSPLERHLTQDRDRLREDRVPCSARTTRALRADYFQIGEACQIARNLILHSYREVGLS